MSKEKGSLSTKENKKPKTKRPISKKVTVGGLILSIICFCVAAWLVFGSFSISSNSGSFSIKYSLGLISIFIFIPILIIFIIAICYNAATFRRNYEKKELSSCMMAELGLILSVLSAMSIPAFCIVATNKAAEFDARVEEQELQKEEKKKAYKTNPTITYEIPWSGITNCYSYEGNLNYMAARDAICSYLRYTYSNDWREPETIQQLLSSEYTPEYFTKSMVREGEDNKQHRTITIKTSGDNFPVVSRSSLRKTTPTFKTAFIITPHRTCSNKESDSTISVWYLDNHYDADEGDLVCVYYGYNSDSTTEEENATSSMYTADFEQNYKSLLEYSYKKSISDTSTYNFSIPLLDEGGKPYIYNSTNFLNTFFSGWPNL